MALWASPFDLLTGHSCSGGLEQRQTQQYIAGFLMFIKVQSWEAWWGRGSGASLLCYPNQISALLSAGDHRKKPPLPK